jgi:hypothetical protein
LGYQVFGNDDSDFKGDLDEVTRLDETWRGTVLASDDGCADGVNKIWQRREQDDLMDAAASLRCHEIAILLTEGRCCVIDKLGFQLTLPFETL